jgi:hypothetical protein
MNCTPHVHVPKIATKSSFGRIRRPRHHIHRHSGAKAGHRSSAISPCPATLSLSRRSFLAGAKLAFGAGLATGAGLAASGVSAAFDMGVHDIDDRHDGGGGIACFLLGTRVQTPLGLVAVEDLRIGDAVSTVSGEAKPVKWIGRLEASPAPPIKIAQFAIDGKAPLRDLYVTPRHAIYVDGYLVPAINLVNGVTIIANSRAGDRTFTYYHIEFETHEVILAEGLTVESYLAENGVAFSNSNEYLSLYGPRTRSMSPFAPVLSYNRLRNELASYARSTLACLYDLRTPLDKIRDRIAEQASRSRRPPCLAG